MLVPDPTRVFRRRKKWKNCCWQFTMTRHRFLIDNHRVTESEAGAEWMTFVILCTVSCEKRDCSMFQILEKTPLNPTVTKMVIDAPLIAKKAEPGQFIIFRATADGERVPLTIADYDREKRYRHHHFPDCRRGNHGLNALNVGDSLADFIGPLSAPEQRWKD